jgi:methanogenic corrinoid protein MtbC1
MHEQGSFAASVLCSVARTLAAGVVARQTERDADGVSRYTSGGQDLVADTEVRFGYLAEALATDRPRLFTEQLAWLKVLCVARDVDLNVIRLNVECMIAEVEERMHGDTAERASAVLRAGIEHLDQAPTEIESYLAADQPHIDLCRRFLLAVLETREQDAIELILDAYERGVSIADLHEQVMHRVQLEVGRMWQMAEVTIAEEHYCTGIVTTITTLLRARVPRPEPNGRRVITAMPGSETHDLGLRLVTQAFELDGWVAFHLGATTPASAIIEAARDFGCDAIALSTNIILYLRQTADVIAQLRANPVTAELPIIVGGQPFNLVDDLWKLIGADGCATSSMNAPQVVGDLLDSRA